jgi:hypothetical protein
VFLALNHNPLEIYETAFNNVKNNPIILLPLIIVVTAASVLGIMLGHIILGEKRRK